MKGNYQQFIRERNLEGSNKATSYIRALELLEGILNQPNALYPMGVDFWSISSVAEVARVYDYALQNQRKEGSMFLQSHLPPSYGRNGYYSAALKYYGKFLTQYSYEQELWAPYQSNQEEALRVVKTRVNQNVFRKMILDSYSSQCAVTGLNIPEVLRASHILPWAESEEHRLNPSNGVCLSATYDAAFDRHLISFDEDYRMILSPELKEYHSNESFKEYFLKREGTTLRLPHKFLPKQDFLTQHREKLA